MARALPQLPRPGDARLDLVRLPAAAEGVDRSGRTRGPCPDTHQERNTARRGSMRAAPRADRGGEVETNAPRGRSAAPMEILPGPGRRSPDPDAAGGGGRETSSRPGSVSKSARPARSGASTTSRAPRMERERRWANSSSASSRRRGKGTQGEERSRRRWVGPTEKSSSRSASRRSAARNRSSRDDPERCLRLLTGRPAGARRAHLNERYGKSVPTWGSRKGQAGARAILARSLPKGERRRRGPRGRRRARLHPARTESG